MKLMSQGTKSILFGAHQFIVHPYFVYKAFKLCNYRKPQFWELICIIIHDWGYWGMDYLIDRKVENWRADDGHEKLGARIALRLFGLQGYKFVMGHGGEALRFHPKHRSAMYWPDKISSLIAPRWWLQWTMIVEKFPIDVDTWRSEVIQRLRAEDIHFKDEEKYASFHYMF